MTGENKTQPIYLFATGVSAVDVRRWHNTTHTLRNAGPNYGKARVHDVYRSK